MADLPQVAFLAGGKLYVKRGAKAAEQVESPFAQGVLDRAAQYDERHGWRKKDAANPFQGNLLWGKQSPQADVRKVSFTGLTRAPAGDGSLLYALDTGAVGGLFAYDLAAGTENRLFHRQEFRAEDLSAHPRKHLVAMARRAEDGSSAIAVMEPGGRKLEPVTEGDSVDQAPAWVEGLEDGGENSGREVLVYQTAGIGRNQRGARVELGPYAIHRLELDRGKHALLLEDAAFDYLAPRARMEQGGEVLYFIRRPYKAAGHGNYTAVKLAQDIVLFPFRLARAVFAFLNVMSIIFAKKPLTAAGGPQTEKLDTRFMFLHGQVIDAEKVIKAARGQPAALVPATWVLMRMDAEGKVSELAKAVLAFDLAADGGVVFTNGSEVFYRDAGGHVERMCTNTMIQQVMVIA